MKLSIRGKGMPITFYLPFSFFRILAKDEDNGPLFRELYGIGKKALRKYKGLKVLEVISKEGTRIAVTL